MLVKILSYNVQCWGSNHSGAIEITLDAIVNADCDVLLLQETNALWEDAIVGLLGEVYPHRIAVDPGASGGQLLMSKFPFESAEVLHVEEYVENSWFPAMVVAVKINGRRVWLVSVHLHPPYDANDRPGKSNDFFLTW